MVEQKDIVRGYEVSKGRYVVLSPEDLKAANPKSTQTIDVLGFLDATAISPVYYAKPYVIAPLKGSEKAYILFREALEKEGKIGLAQVVVHTRQYVAAVVPHDGLMLVQLLRYERDLKTRAELGMEALPTPARAIRPAEMTMAKRLIESMATEWNPGEYQDEYRDDLLALIQRRTKKGADREVAEAADTSEPEETKVLDLMAALRRSVEGKGSGRKSAKKTAAPARKRSTRKSA